MFEDEKIRLIDAMPEGVMVIYVWIRLLVQAGKINGGGCVYLNENIPYTAEMLATLFGKPLEAIKSAFKILCDFQMIEIDSNNIIKILNWERHQNVEGMERVRAQNRKRAENHRKKIKEGEQASKENSEVNIDSNNSEEKENETKEGQWEIKIAGNNEENIDKVEEAVNCNSNNNREKSWGSNLEVINTDSNVTVTEQNKKENKNKKEIKRESNNLEIKNKELSSGKEAEDKTQTNNLNAAGINDNSDAVNNNVHKVASVNSKALEIILHYEKLTGMPGIINAGSIALALDMHGEKYVKMAINKAIEVNKVDMNYINGILKNWRREGYPKEDVEVKKNDHGTIGKNGKADKNEFTGIKPKEPRRLTEEERRRVEEKLI